MRRALSCVPQNFLGLVSLFSSLGCGVSSATFSFSRQESKFLGDSVVFIPFYLGPTLCVRIIKAGNEHQQQDIRSYLS